MMVTFDPNHLSLVNTPTVLDRAPATAPARRYVSRRSSSLPATPELAQRVSAVQTRAAQSAAQQALARAATNGSRNLL